MKVSMKNVALLMVRILPVLLAWVGQLAVADSGASTSLALPQTRFDQFRTAFEKADGNINRSIKADIKYLGTADLTYQPGRCIDDREPNVLRPAFIVFDFNNPAVVLGPDTQEPAALSGVFIGMMLRGEPANVFDGIKFQDFESFRYAEEAIVHYLPRYERSHQFSGITYSENNTVLHSRLTQYASSYVRDPKCGCGKQVVIPLNDYQYQIKRENFPVGPNYPVPTYRYTRAMIVTHHSGITRQFFCYFF